MAKTNRRDIELNPRFPVPPMAIDVRQENEVDSYQNYEGDDQLIVEADEGAVLKNPNTGVPMAPSNYTIISQDVRTGIDGRTVVDVLIEFPDMAGFGVDVKVRPA